MTSKNFFKRTKIVSDNTGDANTLNKNFVEAVRHFSDKSGCRKKSLR